MVSVAGSTSTIRGSAPQAITARPVNAAVIVPAMTAAFTGLAVIACGALPRIVDVEPATLTIDPAACAAAVNERTRAIVPVHLFGQAADMAAIRRIAERH